MLHFLSEIEWTNVVGEIFSNLSVTLVTALIGGFFVNKYLSKLNFSNKMQSYGFVNTSTNKQSIYEIKKMCKEAKLIKIINVSGYHYLNTNESYLKDALINGVEIRFLCCDPESVFLKNIEHMEYNTTGNSGKRMREKSSEIKNEIWDLIEKYKEIGLQIRFYNSEYRLPYVIAYYEDDSAKAWLTMTLPPYKSTKSFVLRGKRDNNLLTDEDISFVDMMEINFDTIWQHNSKSLEEIVRK